MRSRSAWLVVLLFAMGIGLRLIHLDADPCYYEWNGYLVDEGLWTQHARSLALHGVLWGGHARELHLLLAPLFNLIHYGIFSVAGVSIWNARVFTAVCGSAIPVLFWWALRRDVTAPALLLGLVLLTAQVDLVELSRIAVPEVAVMLIQFVIYVVLTRTGGESRRSLAAGVLMSAATGLKATAAPMLAIFSAMAYFVPRPSKTANARAQRWSFVGRFWLGFAAPIVIAGLAGLAYVGFATDVHTPQLFSSFAPFLRLATPYSAVAFVFDDRFGRTVDLWALGVWLAVLAWTTVPADDMDPSSRRYGVTSAIWFGLYFILMSLCYYFPTRYKVHILLPMAVLVTVGVSFLQRLGVKVVISSFAHDRGMRRHVRLGVLSLPTAAFLAQGVGPFMGSIGVDPGRLRFKIACLAVAWAAAAAVAHRLKRHHAAVGFFVVFPLLAGLAWWLASELSIPCWSLVATCAVAAAALARSAGAWTDHGCTRFVYLCAGCSLVSALVALAPGYLDPHYSIRDASRDLGVRLAHSPSIAVFQAEGLFNDNVLPYKSFDKRTEADEPDTVVVGFRRGAPEAWLERNYRIVTTYRFYVSPELDRWQSVGDSASRANTVATVYARTRDRETP